MTAQLSWFQASRLNVGDRVVFVDPHDIFPEALVPAGTRGTVTEQGLNEIWSALAVKPDDLDLQKALAEWNGEIILSRRSTGKALAIASRGGAGRRRWRRSSPKWKHEQATQTLLPGLRCAHRRPPSRGLRH